MKARRPSKDGRSRTQQLVADVGLRGVHWARVMTHILSAVEVLEGKPIEEVAWVQQARHRLYSPPC